jgi:hypothetical protein
MTRRLRIAGTSGIAGLLLAAGLGAGASSAGATSTVDVFPTETRAAGSHALQTSNAPVWAWLATKNDGAPVRWNPCTTITWNWKKGKARDVALMRKAVANLSRAIGVTFAQTSTSPDVSIRYSNKPGAQGALGLGGFRYTGGGQGEEIVAGSIDIDKKLKKKKSKRQFSKSVRKELFMHEWGHVVGLDHVDSRNELMYRSIGGYLKNYGPGDREGLRILGDKTECSAP